GVSLRSTWVVRLPRRRQPPRPARAAPGLAGTRVPLPAQRRTAPAQGRRAPRAARTVGLPTRTGLRARRRVDRTRTADAPARARRARGLGRPLALVHPIGPPPRRTARPWPTSPPPGRRSRFLQGQRVPRPRGPGPRGRP